MAQDTSEVMRTPSVTSHGTGTGASSSSDAEYLRQQIADTRADMTETIDAIQDRVSPRNVLNRTKATIKDSTMVQMRRAAHSMGKSAGYVMARTEHARGRMMRMTRENPATAAAIGMALLYFVVRALRGGGPKDYLYEDAAL